MDEVGVYEMNKDDFIISVFELAFGDNARPPLLNDVPEEDRRMSFNYEDVIDRLQDYSDKSYLIEQMDDARVKKIMKEFDVK